MNVIKGIAALLKRKEKSLRNGRYYVRSIKSELLENAEGCQLEARELIDSAKRHVDLSVKCQESARMMLKRATEYMTLADSLPPSNEGDL